MSANSQWWAAANGWLCMKAAIHFAAWAKTRDGRKWLRSQYGKRKRLRPEQCGYSQPDWMRECREALGRNDEAAFKAIKLANL